MERFLGFPIREDEETGWTFVDAPCGCYGSSHEAHHLCDDPHPALLAAEKDGFVTRHLLGRGWTWILTS